MDTSFLTFPSCKIGLSGAIGSILASSSPAAGAEAGGGVEPFSASFQVQSIPFRSQVVHVGS
jgi:hypothetical protein